MELKSKERLFMYLEPEGARGCGHIGFVFMHENGKAEKIYQSALNPKAPLMQLLLFNQEVKVIIRKYRNVKSVLQVLDTSEYFEIKTKNAPSVREKIEQYISDNKPYNSIFNNCARFLHYALQGTNDVRSIGYPIPHRYYKLVKKLNGF